MKYVDIQRLGNSLHRNGLFEGYEDVAKLHHVLRDAGQYEDVLEVGCRTGLGAYLAASRNLLCNVLGIDIVPEFIEVAEIRRKLSGMVNLEYAVHDVHEDMSELGEFDFVFSDGVFEHFHNPPVAVANIMEVTSHRFIHMIDLAPGGSHFTAMVAPTYWTELFQRHTDNVRWVRIGDMLVVEGVK